MRPSDSVRHMTQPPESAPVLDLPPAAEGPALAGDHHRGDARVTQLFARSWLRCGRRRGDRAHHPTEQGVDAGDRRGQQRRVGRVALVHAVIEHDPPGVVDHLGLVAELHRLPGTAFRDRAGVGVVQADQPARRGRHHPPNRLRVWATTCRVRPRMISSSATAATSRPEACPLDGPGTVGR